MILREKGIEPVMESVNPYKTWLKCWVYEETPELLEALDDVFRAQSEVAANG